MHWRVIDVYAPLMPLPAPPPRLQHRFVCRAPPRLMPANEMSVREALRELS